MARKIMKRNFNRVSSRVPLFALLLLVSISSSYGQKINWLTFEQALDLQKKEPKKIFMDVYTEWCAPCKVMDKVTFQNENVVAYVNDNFYAVKFNGEGNEEFKFMGEQYSNPEFRPSRRVNKMHQFTQFLGVQGYPTIVFFDSDGSPIFPVMGFMTVDNLEIYLKLVLSEDYKKVTTKEQMTEYIDSFVYTFTSD